MRLYPEAYCVTTMHQELGIFLRCPYCKRSLGEGWYWNCLVILRDEGIVRYWIDLASPVFCGCNQNQEVLRLFNSLFEADRQQREIMKILERDSSAESLNIVEADFLLRAG